MRHGQQATNVGEHTRGATWCRIELAQRVHRFLQRRRYYNAASNGLHAALRIRGFSRTPRARRLTALTRMTVR